MESRWLSFLIIANRSSRRCLEWDHCQMHWNSRSLKSQSCKLWFMYVSKQQQFDPKKKKKKLKSVIRHRDSCCCCRNHLRAQTPPSRMKIPEVRQLRHSSAQLSCRDIIDNFLLPTVRKQDIIKVTEQLIEAISNGDFESYTWVTQIRAVYPLNHALILEVSPPPQENVWPSCDGVRARGSGESGGRPWLPSLLFWKLWVPAQLKVSLGFVNFGLWPFLIWTLQCGLKTVNQSTPPSWTLTSTWLATRPRALLTSE